MISLIIDEPSGGLTNQTGRLYAGDSQTTFTNQLGQRGTATLDFEIDPDDDYEPTTGAPVFIYDQEDNPPLTLFDSAPGMFDSTPGVFDSYGGASPVCMFAGTIDTQKKTWWGNDGYRRVQVGVVSLDQCFDTILSTPPRCYTNETAGAIVADLLNYFAGGVPVGIGLIQAGATIDSFQADAISLSSAFNQLAQLASEEGFIWYVNPQDQNLYFTSGSEAPAPFELVDGQMLLETEELDETRQDFRDRQLVRIEPSGAQSSVVAIQNTGSGLLGPNLDLYWQPAAIGSAVISRDTIAQLVVTFTALPSPGDTLTVNDGRVYTWVSTLDNTIQNQILIGATPALCAQNLADAIDAEPFTAGVGFSLPTQENGNLTAWWQGVIAIGLRPLAGPITTKTVIIYNKVKGAAGNGLFLTTTSTAYTLSNSGVLSGATGTGSSDATLQITQGTVTGSDAPAGQLVWELGFVEVDIPAALLSGQMLYVVYRRYGADTVAVENTTLVNERAAIEHGTGKYQLLIDQSSAIADWQDGYNLALANLNAWDTIPDTFSFQTDSPGQAGLLTPGMNIEIGITKPTGIAALVSGTWLVREVDAVLIAGYADGVSGHFRYTITVINTTSIVNYISFWTQLASGSGSSAAGGSAGSSEAGSTGPVLLSGMQSVAPGSAGIVQHGGAYGDGTVTTGQAPGPNMMVIVLSVGRSQSHIVSATGVTIGDDTGTEYTIVPVNGTGINPPSPSDYWAAMAIAYGFPSSKTPITLSGSFVFSDGSTPNLSIAYVEVSGAVGLDTYISTDYGQDSATLDTSIPDVIIAAYAVAEDFGTPTCPAQTPLTALDTVSGASDTGVLATAYDILGGSASNLYHFLSSSARGSLIVLALQIASGSFNPGQDGDFYMDLARNRLYGPRAAGVWPVKSWPFGVPD
jgi:hypothetical protein